MIIQVYNISGWSKIKYLSLAKYLSLFPEQKNPPSTLLQIVLEPAGTTQPNNRFVRKYYSL